MHFSLSRRKNNIYYFPSKQTVVYQQFDEERALIYSFTSPVTREASWLVDFVRWLFGWWVLLTYGTDSIIVAYVAWLWPVGC